MAVGHNFDWEQPGAGLSYQGITDPIAAFDRWVIGATGYGKPVITSAGPSAAYDTAQQGGNILLDIMAAKNPTHSVLQQAQTAAGYQPGTVDPNVLAQLEWEQQYGHLDAKNVYNALLEYAKKHDPGVPLTGENLAKIDPQWKADALDWYYREEERKLSKDNDFMNTLAGKALLAAASGGIGAASTPLVGALAGGAIGGMTGDPMNALSGALAGYGGGKLTGGGGFTNPDALGIGPEHLYNPQALGGAVAPSSGLGVTAANLYNPAALGGAVAASNGLGLPSGFANALYQSAALGEKAGGLLDTIKDVGGKVLKAANTANDISGLLSQEQPAEMGAISPPPRKFGLTPYVGNPYPDGTFIRRPWIDYGVMG